MKKSFTSESEYLKHLKSQAALPRGFEGKVLQLKFTPEEEPQKKSGEPNVQQMNMALVRLMKPTDSFAAMFTRNKFPGAPVVIGRERLGEKFIQSVIINNKVSNVCAEGGVEASEHLCKEIAEEVGCSHSEVIPCSTGVIGRKLPVEAMLSCFKKDKKKSWEADGLDLAQAIMTTDRYPKLIKVPVRKGSILGIAKGAGMVEPKMATMLAYIFTDIDISREDLRHTFKSVVEKTFNRISVDASQSTSDTVLAFSSREVKGVSLSDFSEGLKVVCSYLAEEIVRNGEGTKHVLEVTVSGAPNEEMAARIGRGVINNPLFKAAIAGNDPNVGRLAGAVGDVLGDIQSKKMDGVGTQYIASRKQQENIEVGKIVMQIGGIEVFREGVFSMSAEKEEQLFRYFKSAEMDPHVRYPMSVQNIEVGIDLDQGEAASQVWGSDLTSEYVEINADYRT